MRILTKILEKKRKKELISVSNYARFCNRNKPFRMLRKQSSTNTLTKQVRKIQYDREVVSDYQPIMLYRRIYRVIVMAGKSKYRLSNYME